MLEIITDNGYAVIKKDGKFVTQKAFGALRGEPSEIQYILYENGNPNILTWGTFADGITLDGEALTFDNILEKTAGLFLNGGSAPSSTPKIVTTDSTSNNLTIDLSAQRNRHTITYTGTDSGVVSFINLANADSETFVVVDNNNKDFSLIVPTADIVVDGITYAIKNMYNTLGVISFVANKSIEIHVAVENIDETHGEIRIAVLKER